MTMFDENDNEEHTMDDPLVASQNDALLLKAKARAACEARRERGDDVTVKGVARDLGVRNESVNDYVTEWKEENPLPIAACIVNPADAKAIEKLVRDLIKRVSEAAEGRIRNELFGNAKVHEEAMAAKDAELAKEREDATAAKANEKRLGQQLSATAELLAQAERGRIDDKATYEAEAGRLRRENADLEAGKIAAEARHSEAVGFVKGLTEDLAKALADADKLREELELLRASKGRDSDKEDPET